MVLIHLVPCSKLIFVKLMLVPSFTEGSTSGWPRIFIKIMTFFGFVVLLFLCFFSTSGFGLMISGMMVISALSIYFDSLWDLFPRYDLLL